MPRDDTLAAGVTALSRAAADRAYHVEDFVVRVDKGTPIRCNLCHGFPDEEDD